VFGDIAAVRNDGLSTVIVERDLAAIVACSYEALCYFAGTDIRSQMMLPERLAFLVALRGADPSLLVCNIEESQARTQSWITDVDNYVEFEHEPAAELTRILRRGGVTRGRVGVEETRLPVSALRVLQRELPDVELVSIDRELAALQTVKSQPEIERLGGLARDLLASLDATIAALGGHGSEAAYSGELFSRVSRTGATPIFQFFASGERTTLGHPDAEQVPMVEGSIWRTDFGARLPGGLCGDVARTGVVGEASAEQQEIFAAVRSAQDAIVAAAEPGCPAKELYFACQREFHRSNLPFLLPHVGHGIGVGLHEAPLLEPRNDTPLAVGTVMMIEPFAIMKDRKEGYHTEDMVLVTADGPRRLTVPQDALMVLS
jgi:Xaa-Pro aminopeptidase